MQLTEQNITIIDAPSIPLIYFLLDENNIVVYVGQTTRGLERPFSHWYSKSFKRIAYQLFDVDENELNKIELSFIQKYQPKYNISGIKETTPFIKMTPKEKQNKIDAFNKQNLNLAEKIKEIIQQEPLLSNHEICLRLNISKGTYTRICRKYKVGWKYLKALTHYQNLIPKENQ